MKKSSALNESDSPLKTQNKFEFLSRFAIQLIVIQLTNCIDNK